MNTETTKFIENPKIAIPTKRGYIFIRPDDIIRCESNKKKSICILKNNIQEEMMLSLKQTESMLKKYGFLKVHHAHLININHVEKYEKEKYSASGGTVTMSSGEIVNISVRKKKAFKNYFKTSFAVS